MNAAQARALLLSLPHVLEAEQWGGLIFWLGDKAIGGKMFAMLNLEPGHGHPISFPAGAERYHDLLETEGLIPAPYLARAFWVAAERWDALPAREWRELLTAAHALTYSKLTKRAQALLALPRAEQKREIAARKQKLAAKPAKK